MQKYYHDGVFSHAAAQGWELLRVDPTHAKLLNLLALAEHRLGNHAAGVILLQRAIKANPGGAAHWNDLGNVHCAMGNTKEAEHAYQSALVCDPGCAEAFNNLGVMAGDCENFEEARAYYERALVLRPTYADALYNLGIALAALGKFQKALRRYEQAMVVRPEHQSTHFNIALTRLLLGDLAGGWKEWESRWHSPQLASSLRDFSQPAWRGELLAGKRILLYAEQGVGDTLQFVRYVPLVAQLGGKIVLEVQAPLIALFEGQLRRMAEGLQIVARGDTVPPFDVHCALMSLPAIFHTTLATIPRAAGYLFAPGVQEREGVQDALRVGLVWAGNPTHKRDRERSIPFAKLGAIFAVAGVNWYSLQKGVAAEQLSQSAAGVVIENVAESFADYADTARAIAGLDLVVTVDTSVAHLAGAMGKPVWVLLHDLPDWRWLLKRKDTPWYASARLFRQTASGDWASVMAQVARELGLLVAEHDKQRAGVRGSMLAKAGAT